MTVLPSLTRLGRHALTITLGAPSIDMQAASDSGASPTDNITNVTSPLFDINLPSGFGDSRDAQAGDLLKLEISDNASFTDTVSDTLDAGEVAGDIVALPPSAALGDGTYFARARIERGATAGPWSSTLTFVVDATAPAITTNAAQSVNENAVFSVNLAAGETVTWTKTGGADAALFTLSGATLSLPAQDYEAPADADGNNTYVVQVTATDTAGNSTNKTITVTVTDVAEGGGADALLMESGEHLLLETGDRILME